MTAFRGRGRSCSYLGGGGGNQPDGGHVRAPDSLDLLDVPVTLPIHQLEAPAAGHQGALTFAPLSPDVSEQRIEANSPRRSRR